MQTHDNVGPEPRGTEWLLRASALTSEFSSPEAFLYGRKGTPPLSRHVDKKFFDKKWTQKISISLVQYRLAKSITSIFIELFLAEVFCKC